MTYEIGERDMKKILLIDDARLARNLIRRILMEEGYLICGEAADGEEGVEKYKRMKPDLVFCDIKMSGMDGLDCLRKILILDPGAKVVICTSANDHLHVSEALEAGAKEFIGKPIRAAEVIRVTKKLIGRPDKSYKEIMEEQAYAQGIEAKAVLDFFEAFRLIHGFSFDDEKVDRQFLVENKMNITIGIRALLAAKMTSSQADKVTEVFQSLV